MEGTWSWWSPKWDLSKSWDEFHWCKVMITTGLKMVGGPLIWYHGLSTAWIIWSEKNIWKNSLQAIFLQLMQVREMSTSSKIFENWHFNAHYSDTKFKWKIFQIFIDNSDVSFSNLKPVNETARHIQRSLHCKWNISVTKVDITKWLVTPHIATTDSPLKP